MLDNYLIAAVQGCSVVIVASLFFLFFILSNKFFGNRIMRYFIVAAVCTVLLSVSDCLQSYYATLDYPTAARMFFTACGYTFRVLIMYFILLLLFREDAGKLKVIFTVVALINTMASFSAFITEKSFYFTEQNELVRGPLISIPFIASGIYFVFMMICGFRDFKKGNRREFVLVVIIFMLAFAATMTEVIVETRGLLSSVIILALIFYYMNFLSFNYSYDRLTGAFIRNKLYEDADTGSKVYGVITMDMNNLKMLNDTYGHNAGDEALMAIGRATLNCLPPNARFYRLGGDEFAIIFRTEDAAQVKELSDTVRSKVAETGYSAAVGWCMRQEEEELEKAMSRADVMMYEDKGEQKRK